MEATNINRQDLQAAIIQLEQALHSHVYWFNQLIRTIVCQLPPDQHDLADDACHQCHFGQWYYTYSIPELRKHPAFVALGDAHEFMHRFATQILLAISNGKHIDAYEYDKFANSVERLQLEINSLKRELETELYTRDPLTGAINRIDMIPILREMIEYQKRTTIKCAIVMVDFDNFKNINDSYGHTAGDEVLAAASRYLIQNMRGYDKIFRYGGEEFLLCITNVDGTTAFDKVEELRQGLAALIIDIGHQKNIDVTASFGLSMLNNDISIEENLERADQAMYRAKKQGRNCTVVWKSE